MKYAGSLLLILMLAAPAVPAAAQALSNVTGTIDSFMIDEGYIVIDGRRLVVREADLVITYAGEVLRPSMITDGLRVMYSTRDDGTVSTITVLGPATAIDQIQQQ